MEDEMTIKPLGSGQEVGRSCHLLQFRDMNVLLDCGVHPGYDGVNGLPFLDEVEVERIDALLVTHFHLDHAAALPYLTEKTGFRGRVFMTHPTKAVIRLLLGDYVRLTRSRNGGEDDDGGGALYTEEDLRRCVDRVELVDYHQTVSVGSMRFRALNAGHVLGAAMFQIEIGGRTVLYTGDYSLEDDRHLSAAEIPDVVPDVLIVESTYGVQVHASRAEREARFLGTVERVVRRGGRCLIPTFALGRAQELLLILDERWQSDPHLAKTVPIWYASRMASRALRVYRTYSNMMNARVRERVDVGNPFALRHVRNLRSIEPEDGFDDRGACVVFASPGMLQSGVSRRLFDRWCTDPNNGVVVAGYAVENTLARQILSAPQEVVDMEGRRRPLRCLVDYVSFSAHADFVQNRNFIQTVKPKNIVLVHGQKDEMGRLKGALWMQYKRKPERDQPTIKMPPNLQPVVFRFPRRRDAKVMGRLATATVREGEAVKGVLVERNLSARVVAPEDLPIHTGLRVGSVRSVLHVPWAGEVATVRLFLTDMFADVQEERVIEQTSSSSSSSSSSSPNKERTVVVFALHENRVTLTMGEKVGLATVEWEADPAGDLLADALLALLTHAQTSPISLRLSSQPCAGARRPREGDDGDDRGTPKEEEEEPKDSKRPRGDSDAVVVVDSDAVVVVDPDDDQRRSRLSALHRALTDQFGDDRVEREIVTERDRVVGTFTVVTDTGLDAPSERDDPTAPLLCATTVEFEEGDTTAKITVECEDEKLATNVRECLRTVAAATVPLKV